MKTEKTVCTSCCKSGIPFATKICTGRMFYDMMRLVFNVLENADE